MGEDLSYLMSALHLSPKSQTKSTYEWEIIVLAYAISTLATYLIGRKFVVHTD